MKKRSIKISAFVLFLLLFVALSFVFIPGKTAFAVHNKLSLSESQALFTDNRTVKKINECIDKSSSATFVYLSKHLNTSMQVCDVFKF